VTTREPFKPLVQVFIGVRTRPIGGSLGGAPVVTAAAPAVDILAVRLE
jgi:hypothetical protein